MFTVHTMMLREPSPAALYCPTRTLRSGRASAPPLLPVLLLIALSAVAAEPFDRLKFHAAPKPLPAGAQTENWPRFLGPHDNATSGETKLLHTFPTAGLTPVWEVEKGSGFGGPAIKGDHLVLFHRIGGKETVHWLNAETRPPFRPLATAAPYPD